MVPFRDHATSFTPEQLDVLTTAFYAAMAELTTAGVAISQRDLANRILDVPPTAFSTWPNSNELHLMAWLALD